MPLGSRLAVHTLNCQGRREGHRHGYGHEHGHGHGHGGCAFVLVSRCYRAKHTGIMIVNVPQPLRVTSSYIGLPAIRDSLVPFASRPPLPSVSGTAYRQPAHRKRSHRIQVISLHRQPGHTQSCTCPTLFTLLASKHEARITVTVGASVLLPCPDSHLSSQACLQASEPTLPIRPSQAARASPPRSQGHHHQSQRQRRSQNHIDRQRHLYLRYRLEPSRRNSSVSDNNQLPIPLRLLPSPPA